MAAAGSLEHRLRVLEQQLLDRLERESQEHRACARALEERLSRLERASSGSPPTAAKGSKVDPGSESGSDDAGEDEDDEAEQECCLARAEKGQASEASSAALQETYALEESMWDASVFVFMDCLGTWPSLNVVGLMLLNILTQFFFLFVVYKYMIEDSMSSSFLESLLKFRASVAHAAKYADLTQGMSLASQVCGEDEKIPWAGMQLGLIGDISKARHGGLYLCTLAVLCWLVTLVGELDSSVRFGGAMASLLKGRRTVLVVEQAEGGGAEAGPGEMRLEALSSRRLAFMMVLVVLPRLLVVLGLGYVGVKFLVVTTSLGDLLLNALALAFITDVDNMFFAAFAPERLKSIVRTVSPVSLPVHGRRHCRTCGLSTLGKVTLVFACLALVFYTWISPFYWRMNQAYDILCSGERDFVTAINSATGFVEAAASFKEPFADWITQELAVLQLAKPHVKAGPGFHPPQQVLEAVHSDTVEAIIQMSVFDVRKRLDTTKVDRYGNPTMQPLALEDLRPNIDLLLDIQRTGSETVLENIQGLACGDMTFSASTFIVQRELARITSGHTTCEQAIDMCHWLNMTSLRALCPVTCGCRALLDPPASFFAGPGFGCPKRCEIYTTLEQLSEGQALPCADVAPIRFVEDIELKKYFALAMGTLLAKKSFIMAAHTALTSDGNLLGISRNESGRAFSRLVRGQFLEAIVGGRWDLAPGRPHPRGLKGCQFWTSWEVSFLLGVDFCDASMFRSLRPYCPVSCGCRKGDRQCPANCAAAPSR